MLQPEPTATHLEGVTVCIGFADYLALGLSSLSRIFDHIVVVTVEQDAATRALCVRQGLACVVTNASSDPNQFDRGMLINEGFKALRHRDWVVHFDSDTVVPTDFRQLSDLSSLHKDLFYGCRRVIVPTAQDYADILSRRKHVNQFDSPGGYGYGYFQLFNWTSGVIGRQPANRWYPSAPGVTESDWRFRNLWGNIINEKPTDLLRELPFPVLHLGMPGEGTPGVQRFFGAAYRDHAALKEIFT